MKKISIVGKTKQEGQLINKKENIKLKEDDINLDKVAVKNLEEKDNNKFNKEDILKVRRKRREELYRDLRQKICVNNESLKIKSLILELEKLNENKEHMNHIQFYYLETMNLVELLIAKINSDFINYTNYDKAQQSHCVEIWRSILKEVLDRIDNITCELLIYVNDEKVNNCEIAIEDYKEYKVVAANLREVYRSLNHFNEISNTHNFNTINKWLNEIEINKLKF